MSLQLDNGSPVVFEFKFTQDLSTEFTLPNICFAVAAFSNAQLLPKRPRIANSKASGKAGEAEFERLSETGGAESSDRAGN